MKLSKHQKEIIKRIISNEIYDIKSYLQYFNKCHTEKYDISELRNSFDKAENGKQYKVIKDNMSLFQSSSVEVAIGPSINIPKIRTNLSEGEYELKPAEFIDKAPPIKYTYKSNEYEFDFVEGVSVINNFDEVIDFLTLWAYLKQEKLILEVSEQITAKDIGLFFQRTNTDTNHKKGKIIVKTKKASLNLPSEYDFQLEAPKRFAHEYTDITWKINDTNLLTCNDFLGKKIIRTSALITFAKKKFKTSEQISQDNNFRIALIALVLSVISIIMGNIIPLFQKQPTEYMDNIVQQLEEIKIELHDLTEAKNPDQKTEEDLKKS